jgi:hypothetical protein
MRATDTNLIIIPYVEFNQLDLSKIKIRQPNHLFDIDPTKNNSNKRTRVDALDVISTMVSSHLSLILIFITFILAYGYYYSAT